MKSKEIKVEGFILFRVQFGAAWHNATLCILLKAMAHSAKKCHCSALKELRNHTDTANVLSNEGQTD